MGKNDQTDAANKFAREMAGAKVDPKKSTGDYRVLDGGDDDGKGGSDRPTWEFIKLPGEGRPLSQFARELGSICKEGPIYRRETVPVTINPEDGGMEAIIPDRFRTFVEEFAVTHIEKPMKDEHGETEWVKRPQTMTKDCAGGVINADQYVYQLRRLDRVNKVRMPVMRRDGRIELLPVGYDAESHVYTMESGVEIRDMPVAEARAVIDSLLKEFPFGDFDENGYSRSKAVAITAMLSLYAAGLQRLNANRLNFVFTANSQRSGKSLLAEIAIIMSCGEAEVKTLGENKEELRKVLETEALASSPYIYFDNLEGNIKNPTLDAFMTASVWSGRLMNSQKKFKAPKVSQVFLTGNNLTLSTDLANRTLLCELYVKEADPQARAVKRVIDGSYLQRDDVRGDVLSALWALIKNWDAEGRPRPERPIRGYEEWSNIFGGIMIANGWGNPLSRPDTAHSGDSEMTDMCDLMEALVEEMGMYAERDFEFAELGKICVEKGFFQWMLDWDERSGSVPGERIIELKPKSKAILGKMWTGKYGGRIFVLRDGRRVEFGSKGKNRQKKYLMQILPS